MNILYKDHVPKEEVCRLNGQEMKLRCFCHVSKLVGHSERKTKRW